MLLLTFQTIPAKHPSLSQWKSSITLLQMQITSYTNSSIDASVKSLDDLLAKDELLADFKAVKEGNVWITDNSMYQHTDTIGELINDLNLMFTDGGEENMTFLHTLN